MEENKIGEKFLPAGTVVKLKDGIKRVMIMGFCATGPEVKEVYDYSGCLYPEGLITSTQICVFNHDQIEKIDYMGLQDDEEERIFKRDLIKAIEEQKN